MFKQFLLVGLTSSFFFLSSEVVNAQFSPRYSESEVKISQVISREKQQLIDEYIELTAGEETFQQLMQSAFSQMEEQFSSTFSSQLVENLVKNKEISPEKRQEIAAKLNQQMSRIVQKSNRMFLERINYQQIVEEVYYPIYDKYFNEDDLRALIDFYQTPIGRKTLEIMPRRSKSLSIGAKCYTKDRILMPLNTVTLSVV